MSGKPTKRRVKVYKMADSTWEDQGTGYIECLKLEVITKQFHPDFSKKFDAPALVVKSEDNESIILESKIDPRPDTYMSQQDTLIVWSEPALMGDESLDLALSFQEAQGCQEIWNEIVEIQKSLQSEAFADEIELPPANLSNIDKILSVLSSSSVHEREAITKAILNSDFLKNLFALYEIVDDLENQENFVKMFRVVKLLFLLNSRAVNEELVSDKYCLLVFKALEHDPNPAPGLKTSHSDFLQNHVTFKEIVPFKEPQVLKKIHQTFRLTYLKDIALPKNMEETVFLTLASMVQLNDMQIIQYLTSDVDWLGALLALVKVSADDAALSEQLAFIYELIEMSQFLEEKHRSSFFQTLVSGGLFQVIEHSIASNNVKTKTFSARILIDLSNSNPNFLRNYVYQQEPTFQFFKFLVNQLPNEEDSGMKIFLLDIIRNLLIDPPNDDGVTILKITPKMNDLTENLVTVFYDEFAMDLLHPIMKDVSKDPPTESLLLLKSNLCELMGTFVEKHGVKLKNFIVKRRVLPKIFHLLKAKEKYIAAAAIRLFRKLVGTEGSAYDQHIVDENLLEPILQLFQINGDRYNVLNSVILELFDHISELKNNHTLLIKHYFETFHEQYQLDQIPYPNPFTTLASNYQKAKDLQEKELELDSAREMRRRQYVEELEEEAWFEEDDEDKESDGKTGANALIEEIHLSLTKKRERSDEEEPGDENQDPTDENPKKKIKK